MKIANKKIYIIAFTILLMLIVVIKLQNKEQQTEQTQILNVIVEEKDIFTNYYEKANKKRETLTLREQISQLFIVGTFENSDFEELQKYNFGGYLFFKDFFDNKKEEQIKNEIQSFQEKSKIPLLIAVDEEGGTVVRVSKNKNLIDEPFLAPSQIYKNGGMEAIKQDTIKKSIFLENLGINVNFAPVVDIVTNENNYMYNRSLQQSKEITSEFAKTVIRN